MVNVHEAHLIFDVAFSGFFVFHFASKLCAAVATTQTSVPI